MTTRRRNSDSMRDESSRNKYHRVQSDALSQVQSSKDHMPQSENGVSSSETPSYADSAWRSTSCVSTEGPLGTSSVKASQQTSSNLDPGLGQLSVLSPEIRDLIYELIPIENDPDIASLCRLKELHWTSKSLSRDLYRSWRPCTHVDFTFTCDVSSNAVVEHRYGWLRSRLDRKSHAHNLQNIHRVEIIIKNSANPELPTLCYRLVCLPQDRQILHIWFDGPRAGHARLCKFQDQLASSFEAAAMCINAVVEIMRGLPSRSLLGFDSVEAQDGILCDLLRYYAAPQAEEHRGPAGKPALCFLACTNPGNGLLEYHFHPTAQHRLGKLVRDGFIIKDCTLPINLQSRMELDLFDWHHEFFDHKAEWEGQPQGEDWCPST